MKPGAGVVQVYGTDTGDNFLNGIRFAWDNDGTRLTKTQMVTTRGSWGNDVMNTNNFITWNGVGKADIIGTNTPVGKRMVN